MVADSDVVFVASGSETLLINGSDLEGMSAAREAVGGVRRFFDISVPRNVATDVSYVPNSRVFNVDDLKEVTFFSQYLPRSYTNKVSISLVLDGAQSSATFPQFSLLIKHCVEKLGRRVGCILSSCLCLISPLIQSNLSQ